MEQYLPASIYDTDSNWDCQDFPIIMHLPDNWKELGILKSYHIYDDDGDQASEEYYATKKEYDNHKGDKDVTYHSGLYAINYNEAHCVDSTALKVTDRGGIELAYRNEYRHYTQCIFHKIDKSKHGVYKFGDDYIVLMGNYRKEFSSFAKFKTWIIPYWSEYEGLNRDEDYLAGKDYIRSLLGFESTPTLLEITDLDKKYVAPYYIDTPTYGELGHDALAINAYIKNTYRDLEEEHRVKKIHTKSYLAKAYVNINKIPKLNGFAERTVLFGTKGEYMFSMDGEVMYITKKVIYDKKFKNYDKKIVADYKRIQPNIDDLIALVALSVRNGTKMQYTLITGATNVGKTFIAEAMGAVEIKTKASFKQLAKGQELSNSDVSLFAGVLLIDDIGAKNMPDVEGYKTFHNRGLNVGSAAKRRSEPVKHTIITKTDMDILSSANEEYSSRTTVFDLGGSDNALDKSEVFKKVTGKKYLKEVSKYIKFKFREYYKSKDYHLQQELEEKYRLDPKLTAHGIVLKAMADNPKKYFKDVIERNGNLYIDEKATTHIDHLARKLPKKFTDTGALFREFKDGYCKRSTLRGVSGEGSKEYYLKITPTI